MISSGIWWMCLKYARTWKMLMACTWYSILSKESVSTHIHIIIISSIHIFQNYFLISSISYIFCIQFCSTVLRSWRKYLEMKWSWKLSDALSVSLNSLIEHRWYLSPLAFGYMYYMPFRDLHCWGIFLWFHILSFLRWIASCS